MENEAVDAVTLGGQAVGDLSMMGLFWQADPVVKAVLILLVLASFWSWAIIFEKVFRVRRMRKRADQFEEAFWSTGSIEGLYDRISDRPNDPMSAIFVAAMQEWRRFAARGGRNKEGKHGLIQRVERAMEITLGREMERMERYMIFLASVGSAAPFVGLFGTVWGIMNAFSSIAASKNTSLAVVAPGIAEALFATALGLVAAIPAVIAFNKLSNDLGRYSQRLEAFAGEFSAIISREVDEAA